MKILFQILVGALNLMCLGVRINDNIWSVFGGINPSGSVYSLIGVVQYADNNAEAVIGVVQYADNNAEAAIGVVQYAGKDANALIGVVQYAGNDAGALIGVVQYAVIISAKVVLIASIKR